MPTLTFTAHCIKARADLSTQVERKSEERYRKENVSWRTGIRAVPASWLD
jgi:hypothetical protein